LSTLDLGLCEIFTADNLDRANNLANETETVAGSEFRGATLRIGDDLTINSEAPPGAPTNINECTLRKLVVK
jgi:hypothetical protein